MNRLKSTSLAVVRWMGMLAVMTAIGCGAPRDTAQQQALADRQREQDMRIVQQVSQIQQRLAELDRQLAELRALHDQRLNEIMAGNQALSTQLQQMRGGLLVPAGMEPLAQVAAPPAVALPAPVAVADEEGTGSAWFYFFRLILVLILLAAILVIVKIFMGRWNEEEEEDEDFDEVAGDEEIATEMGTIRVSSEVQRELKREQGETPEAKNPEHS